MGYGEGELLRQGSMLAVNMDITLESLLSHAWCEGFKVSCMICQAVAPPSCNLENGEVEGEEVSRSTQMSHSLPGTQEWSDCGSKLGSPSKGPHVQPNSDRHTDHY